MIADDEFVTPNWMLPITWFHMSATGETAAFQDVLPSLKVWFADPSSNCSVGVDPFGHLGPSRA